MLKILSPLKTNHSDVDKCTSLMTINYMSLLVVISDLKVQIAIFLFQHYCQLHIIIFPLNSVAQIDKQKLQKVELSVYI